MRGGGGAALSHYTRYRLASDIMCCNGGAIILPHSYPALISSSPTPAATAGHSWTCAGGGSSASPSPTSACTPWPRPYRCMAVCVRGGGAGGSCDDPVPFFNNGRTVPPPPLWSPTHINPARIWCAAITPPAQIPPMWRSQPPGPSVAPCSPIRTPPPPPMWCRLPPGPSVAPSSPIWTPPPCDAGCRRGPAGVDGR